MDIKKILLGLFLLATLNLYAGATEWQDIEINNGWLLIDIEVEGVPAKAMLDTGAESIAVNIDFLQKNNVDYQKGSKITVQGVFGVRKKTHQVKNLNVKLFGTEFPIKRAMPFLGGNNDVAMIIGLPFFKNFIFQIDYPNKRIKLITRDILDLKDLQNVEMKHGNNRRSLVVTALLDNDKAVDLLFDTGSTSGLLFERHYVERNGWLEKYTKTESEMSGINEAITTETLELPFFKIGPYSLEDVLLTVPTDGQTTYISEKQQAPETGKKIAKGSAYEGILGYDVLKHFVITLDAKTARMHIIAPE